MPALDAIYGAVLQGIPKVSKPVEEFSEDYLSRHESPRDAANDLVRWQIAKCGTSGFVTGLGGLITKFGEKGIVNLWKAVPVVSGVVGGGLDAVTTGTIAQGAVCTFMPKPEPIKVVVE